MRQRILLVVGAAAAAILVIGLAVAAAQQGIFGGKARQLLAQAERLADQGHHPEAEAKLQELIATYPDSPWMDDALFRLAEGQEAEGRLVDAAAAYRTLLDQATESPLIGKTQEQLGRVNVALLLSPTVTPDDTVYQVKPGDSLGKIASQHGTTVEYLQRANQLSGTVIRPGQKLKIPKGRFSIVVDKSQNQLLLSEGDRFIKTYAVATGKDNSTPVGTFKIVNRIIDPVWYTQGAVVPAGSPDNILGTRWMGLDKKSYGIHGSADPSAIGQQVTAGCVRMRNPDVEELYAIVPVGTEVTIVD